MESFDQGSEGDADADDAKEDPEENDETVVGHRAPVQGGTFEFQVKIAGPNEREHRARERADKSHEDGKMRNRYGHDRSEHHQTHSKGQTPHFQLPVQCPHGREEGFGTALEKGALQQVQRSVVRQRVRQHRLVDSIILLILIKLGDFENLP